MVVCIRIKHCVFVCECSGSCFIRTDQLDGETDWKLRLAVASCQQLQSDQVSVTVYTAL